MFDQNLVDEKLKKIEDSLNKIKDITYGTDSYGDEPDFFTLLNSMIKDTVKLRHRVYSNRWIISNSTARCPVCNWKMGHIKQDIKEDGETIINTFYCGHCDKNVRISNGVK